jgi:hypothetical protein
MIIADRNDTDLYTETVAALTRAALERNLDGSPGDFSDFLAHALAATAANVGGPDRLIAGRPGSWESACVDSLVRGTMGDLPDDWTWFRTQSIVIRLNVAELIEDGLHHPGLMGLDEALENLGKRYESASSEQDLDAWDSDIDAVTDRYTTEYRRYADSFALAARNIASDISGLSADVTSKPTPIQAAPGGRPPPTTTAILILISSRSRSGAPHTRSNPAAKRRPLAWCGWSAHGYEGVTDA